MKLSRILPLMVGGAIAGMVVIVASPANAIVFNFSFDNEEGAVNGTVEGTIELPDGDGTFSATSISITSAPSGLGYTLPVNPLLLDLQFNNSFTVSGGSITSSNYAAQTNSSSLFTLGTGVGLGSQFSSNGTNASGSGVADLDSSTLVYSSAPTAVPFDTPGGQAIATFGSLFALGLMRKAKKRLVAKKLVVNPVETVV